MNGDIYILDVDQPTNCPICGMRTNFDEIENEVDGYYQQHQCPSITCGYSFVAVED